MNNKKALAPAVLIGLIIALISMGIIFLFIKNFPGKEIVDKEACRQSVVIRSASLFGQQPGKSLSPLRCKTQDILLDYNDEVKVKQRIANAMYDCWDMLGEGKLDFFSEDTFLDVGITKSACVICSTIKFGDRAKQKFQKVDITDYLQDTKLPLQDKTYMEYFTDEEGAKLDTGVRLAALETGKEYAIVYMGIRGGDIGEVIKNDFNLLGKATAGSLMIAGPTGVGKFFTLLKSKAGLIAILGTFIAQELSTIQAQIAAAGRCDLNTKGCNLQILTEYNKEKLEATCGRIESIP